MRRRYAAFATALVAALVAAPPALADGDPASDVLLGQNVFYPYQTPSVPASLMRSLNGATAAAARAHFPIKVALIASPIDLGVIPALFGKPAQYARYLDPEISFQVTQPVLVVMKAGYGIDGMSPAARAALAALRKPLGGSSDDLAQAAVTAVAKLAQAEGRPLSTSSGSTGSGSGGRAVLIVVLVLAAILAASGLLVLRHRQALERGR